MEGRENNLARLREQRELTQKEVAEALDITRQAISQWESGRAFPSMEKQLALCRLYRVTLDQLYPEDTAREGDAEKAVPPAKGEPEEDTPEENRLEKDASRKKGKQKKFVLITVLILAYVSVYTAGVLTHSESMARNTLFLLTCVIILVSLLYLLYRICNTFKKG